MVILQSLRFMDGYQSDAIRLVALNGLAADGLIPFRQETVNVGSILAHEVGQMIVEGTEISPLPLDAL